MVNTQLTFHMEIYTETVGSELENGNNLVVLVICTHSCKQTNEETGQEDELKQPRTLAF